MTEQSQDTWDDPEDFFIHQFAEGYNKLIGAGMAKDEAVHAVTKALLEAVAGYVPDHVKRLKEIAESNAPLVRESRSEFRERLLHHWREPLDLYDSIVTMVEEAAHYFQARNSEDEEGTQLLQVLHQLAGQAIRVAREVHALLCSGYPLGALSLTRTIHEISVSAGILAKFGIQDEYEDLAERFLLHDYVINVKDAETYQRDAGKLGYEPFADDEVEELCKKRDELIERYGKAYGSKYGWASGLPDLKGEPNFARLEAVAGLDHHRGYYQWSSHLVHGDSKAMRLNLIERGGSHAILTAETNAFLADPGQHALLCLYRVFVSMVTSAMPMAFHDQLVCGSLDKLLDEACDAFAASERAVADAEERLQAELADKGMRFHPSYGEIPIGELDAEGNQG